jgi:hypothetical protein
MPVIEGPINRKWRSYLERCVPGDAGDVQVLQTRRAFFAGAAGAMKLMTDIGSPDVTYDQAVETLNLIDGELADFRERIGRDF